MPHLISLLWLQLNWFRKIVWKPILTLFWLPDSFFPSRSVGNRVSAIITRYATMGITHKCRFIYCFVVELYLFGSTKTIFCCNKQQWFRVINLPSTDDNPLSHVWLKDTQDEDQKVGELCNDPSQGFHKNIFSGEELICFTEKDNN